LEVRSPTGFFFIGVVVTIVLAVMAATALYVTGDSRTVLKGAPLIAAVIALGGVGTAQMVSIALDQRRTKHEALQAYLAKMSELLLDKCLHKKSASYDATRVTARLQTLAVLERLDAERKRTVLLFLREAQLINRYDRFDLTTTGPEELFYAHYVGLGSADLSMADLERARLTSKSGQDPVSLSGANLKGATLKKATLSGADLRGADLRPATEVLKIDTSGNVRPETMPVDLRDADLSRANLSGAQGITNEQLKRQAKNLKGTIMPDGSKHP